MEHITIQQLHEIWKKLPSDELILDVRSPEEFAAGHIKGAKNIPHTQVPEMKDELRRYKKIHILCKAGGRAQVAASCLRGETCPPMTCVSSGGMDQWMALGFETE